MTIASGRPRRSKALPLGITALVLLVLPLLALPLLFAVADPYLAVPVLGLLGVASTALGVAAVVVGIRGRLAAVPLRSAVTGAVLGAVAAVLAGARVLGTLGFVADLASGSGSV